MCEKEKARIAQSRQIWIEAINKADPEQFVSVITVDAVWIVPGVEALVGRPRIHAWLTSSIHDYDYQFSISNVEVTIAGSRAAEFSKFETQVSTKNAASIPMIHRSAYSLTWKRCNSRWKIERYIDCTGWANPAISDKKPSD